MMMMMEGIEQTATAGLNHDHQRLTSSSPQYATPPQALPSDSTQTASNLFFPSSASHTYTLFPATATASASNINHLHGHDDHDSTSPSATPSGQENHDTDDNIPLSDADLNEIVSHPWTESSKHEFYTKFNASNPTYKNKLRLAPDAEQRVRHFLLNPSSHLDPNSPADARLKARSKSYTLHPFHSSGILYRNDSTTLRRHVSEAEVWELLTSEHVKSGHKGRDRMLSLIKERFIGYTLDELMFVLGTCRVCARARMGGSGGVGVELAQRVRMSLGVQQAAEARDAQLHEQARQVLAGAVPQMRQNTGGPVNTAARAVPNVRAVPPAFAQMANGRPSSQQVLQAQRMGNKKLMLGAQAEPPRRSLYAPNEKGLVTYDVPDWYY